jgi:hypothetical protein
MYSGGGPLSIVESLMLLWEYSGGTGSAPIAEFRKSAETLSGCVQAKIELIYPP